VLEARTQIVEKLLAVPIISSFFIAAKRRLERRMRH